MATRIRAGDQSAVDELHQILARGIRFLLLRELGPDRTEERVQDVLATVVEAIRSGHVREYERLTGYVRSVVRLHIEARIRETVEASEGERSADIAGRRRGADESERAGLVGSLVETLRSLSPRDREALERFYLLSQSRDQIYQEMGLTEARFRILKSSVRSHFGAASQRKGSGSHRGTLAKRLAAAS